MKFLEVIFFAFLVCQVSSRSTGDGSGEVTFSDVEKLVQEFEANTNKLIALEELVPILTVAIAELEKLSKTEADIVEFCKNKLGVTDEEMSEDKSDILNPPEKMKCFLTCNYEKAGMIKDNELSGPPAMFKKVIDIIAQKFGDDKDNEFAKQMVEVNECLNQPSVGECDKAYNFQICMYKFTL